MNVSLIGAIVCILLWMVLAFVAAIPSGWVHIPLALGVILLAKAILEGRRT